MLMPTADARRSRRTPRRSRATGVSCPEHVRAEAPRTRRRTPPSAGPRRRCSSSRMPPARCAAPRRCARTACAGRPQHVLETLREEVLVMDSKSSRATRRLRSDHRTTRARRNSKRAEGRGVCEQRRRELLALVVRGTSPISDFRAVGRRASPGESAPRSVRERLEPWNGEGDHLARAVATGQSIRNPAQAPHVGRRVEAVSRGLALRHGKAVALLPHLEGVRREAGGPGYRPDRESRLGSGRFGLLDAACPSAPFRKEEEGARRRRPQRRGDDPSPGHGSGAAQ